MKVEKYRGIPIESTLSGWFVVRPFPNDYENKDKYSLKFDTWEGVTDYIDSFI